MKSRHHYIPQWYLKGFCDPETPARQEPYLWVRAVDEEAVRRRAPANIAHENGYYKCGGPNADQLEDELSAIESRAAFALRSYLSKSVGTRGPIPGDLGVFVAWLGARVPAMRRVASEGWGDFLLNAKWGEGELPPANKQYVLLNHVHRRESRRESVSEATPLLRSGDWYALLEQDDIVDFIRLQAWYFQTKLLPRMFWILLTAPPGHRFVVSDRPLVWFIPGRGFADSPAAVKDPDVEVTIPLTRSHALLGISEPARSPTSVWPIDINLRTTVYAERFVAGPTRDAIKEAFEAKSSLPLILMNP